MGRLGKKILCHRRKYEILCALLCFTLYLLNCCHILSKQLFPSITNISQFPFQWFPQQHTPCFELNLQQNSAIFRITSNSQFCSAPINSAISNRFGFENISNQVLTPTSVLTLTTGQWRTNTNNTKSSVSTVIPTGRLKIPTSCAKTRLCTSSRKAAPAKGWHGRSAWNARNGFSVTYWQFRHRTASDSGIPGSCTQAAAAHWQFLIGSVTLTTLIS